MVCLMSLTCSDAMKGKFPGADALFSVIVLYEVAVADGRRDRLPGDRRTTTACSTGN